MELSSHTGSGKAHESSSSTHPEVLPEEVEPSKEPPTKDMELSSHTRSGKDHQSSSDEQDALLEETELSSYSGSDKEYRPSPTPSSDGEMPPDKSKSSSHDVTVRPLPERDCCHSTSSEEEVLEAEQQATRRRSSQPGEQLKKGKRKKKVTVKTTKKRDGGRAWDKAHYCLYCKKANLKMARHLQRKHNDETDVAHAFSFPPGSKQRKALLESLRNKGDWQHNLKVLEDGSGEIVTWKQPSKGASVEDYLPCQHCYAMFKRRELWRHMKSCREKKGDKVQGKRRAQKASSQLIPIKDSSDGLQKIIHSMIQDHVTAHIRGDEMICTYGNALFAKKGREQSQHRYIAQKMRELGRFCLAAKEIDKSVKGLKDVCDPTKFKLAIKAARRVSNYSTAKTEYGKPSTAVKIGFSLKGATETWIGHCLMTSDVLNEKKAKKFKELLDSSWSNYVSTNAHSTMEQRKWNKDDCVPLTEDVVTLQNYLRKIEDDAKAELRERVSTTAYKMLSESLLAQIIVFNKKREGEASRLTLDTYLKADTGPVNKDIYATLSPVEKQLSQKLTRIVTRGKRGRKVPILLLDRTKSSLDFLIKKRSEVGILEENPFLFARIGTTTNIRGCDCLRKYAQECKAGNPELLRSTKLRKHVATLCQLLDLDNQELEQVARFMGHDIRVHCDYYRQTDKTFQVAKIGKLLFAMEHGAKALKGKTLNTLDPVVFGKQHEVISAKGSRGVNARQISFSDRQLEANDDGALPHPSPTSSRVQRRKKARRHDDDDGSDGDESDDGEDGALPHPSPTSSRVQRRKKAQRHDDDDGSDGDESDDGEDGALPHPSPTSSRVQRRKKAQRHDDDDGSDGDESDDGEDAGLPRLSVTSSQVKHRKKAVTTQRHDDDEDGALPHPSPTSSRPPQVLSRRKKAQSHDADESDDDEDGALPHPPPTSSRVQRRKKARRHDDDGSDGDEDAGLPRLSVTSSQVKHRKKAVTTQRHDDDEDGALPHLSPTSSRVQRRKKAQRHDDDGSDGDEDGALPHPSPTSSRVQRRKKAQRHDDDDDGSDGDDESDGDEDAGLPRLSVTSSQVKHRKKAVTTQRHDDDEDGALPHPSPTSSRVQRRKKAQRHDDDGSDGDEDGALPHPSPTSSRVQRRKKAQRHDDDGSDGDEDGALPHPSPTSSRVQRRKKARRHDDDGSDGDENGALPHPSPTSSCVQRRKKARRHDDDDDDDDDDDEDGNKQPTNTTRQKRVKKIAAKRKYYVDADAADDDDGERQNVSSTRPTVKRLKKTANKTQHNDDDVSKVQTKRPWSVEERTAVQRRMTKFVALRKVPAKNDCLLCIEKESPVLSTRTWKDVKYFVYNEIVKVKKKLAF
ncbi:uncharacterized protein LOC126387392 [Epinephelus moara]|uniref:uncharacterized protein LOC126387392 n=1 Tax=Epinephelus moara TaxID=300413 RepID=UPI00214F2C12|nr:uncharacterized protein LOC126387392 [Epinephelus moara]